MKLRLRLTVTALAITLPVVVVILRLDKMAQHRAASEILVDIATSYALESRERCEAEPTSWGGRIRPMPGQHRVGDDRGSRPPPGLQRRRSGPPNEMLPPVGGTPSRPAGPPRDGRPPPREPLGPPPRARPAEAFAYDEDFRSRNPEAPVVANALIREVEKKGVAVSTVPWTNDEVEVLVQTPWGHGPCAFILGRGTTDPSWGAILPKTELWLVPMLVVLTAVLVAMGPIVERIRKLERAVARSAKVAYEAPIVLEGSDEISELGQSFDRARREIRELLADKERRERALQDFIANTTHDLMIPLTVLKGNLATLRESRQGDASFEGDERTTSDVLASAMNEAHYMGALVHNLAVAARLDDPARKLERSPVDVSALVARVVARHGVVARETGVSLESAVPSDSFIVSADVTLLEQIVSNVTYNAIRYNHRGGHVAIILEERGETRFGLRVIDDGPGMTDDERARLLERGARGEEARSRAPDGQGLGLFIARRASELHGFDLRLARSEYGGLEVEIEGPRDPAQGEAARESSGARSRSAADEVEE